ncbi:MAG: class I SAM-dependent methyltransferase [Bacteroidota bacterium]
MEIKCKICQQSTTQVFKATILNKYEVAYNRCNSCLFIQTEEPYWLDESYESPMNINDTGIVVRNEILRKRVTCLIFLSLNKEKPYLDYAGGYGLFTRMMRDIGFDFYWIDQYTTNLLARGFEHKEHKKYEAITAFEVFEHLSDPVEEINKMFGYSDTIIFSTLLAPASVPDKSWWYYGFSHGQHISIYSKRALQVVAQKLGANLYTNGLDYHVLSKKQLNKVAIKCSSRLYKYGLYNIFRSTLKSKTQSDHLLLSRS